MPTYRQILGKAWQIAWRNPSLWFFGFFVIMLGSGGEIEILLRSITLRRDEGIIAVLLSGLTQGGFFSLGTFTNKTSISGKWSTG